MVQATPHCRNEWMKPAHSAWAEKVEDASQINDLDYVDDPFKNFID